MKATIKSIVILIQQKVYLRRKNCVTFQLFFFKKEMTSKYQLKLTTFFFLLCSLMKAAGNNRKEKTKTKNKLEVSENQTRQESGAGSWSVMILGQGHFMTPERF